MEILLLDSTSKKLTDAQLIPAVEADMKGITDGWDFSWKKHFHLANSRAFKIVLKTSPGVMEGLMIFQLINKEEPFMAFLESAPHKKGKNKRFDLVAGCLIARACQLSILEGKGHFQGFLAFKCMDEKVISVYARKYGATRVDSTYMYIDPFAAENLIQEYLFI